MPQHSEVSKSPSVVSFSYRDVKKIDLAAFRADLAQSKLLQCSDDLDANAYAELMNDELRQLMDKPRAHQAQGKTAQEKRLSVVIVGSQSSQTTSTTYRAALPSYWQQV